MLKEHKFDGWVKDEATIRRILAAYDLAEETGIPLPELTIRHILSDPDIATQIPGAQNVEHLRANLDAAARGPLPPDLVARIDAIAR